MSRVGSLVNLSEEKLARAALTYLAEPGDPALGALLGICEPAEVLAAIKADLMPGTGPGCGDSPASRTALERALGRWRVRLPSLPDADGIAGACRDGIGLICPGDAAWPSALDQLGQARPYALWLRGNADLRLACSRSVSMVGSRAATGYGGHVAGEIAADLAERGWTIISGGAYGIDAAAHRGALAAEGITIAVLACGVDYPYPAGHADLFAAIAARGLVVSEWPPGRHPARMRFLVRNRVIAALACGTVIVEAGERSGALNTARHAADLGKPLMAVPGPVTSAQSAGCHRIIREWGATCVTGAADIIEMLSPLSVPDALAPGGRPELASSPGSGPGVPPGPDSAPSRDDLDADSARVLDALPARGGAGTSTIAVEAGVDLDTVLRCLGRLAGYGFIERGDGGWRLRRPGRTGGSA
ncbi:MAG: DNA-processing protein DprA [Streptosporangiaceae bacterium]